jgi:hypothetical protein
VRPETTHTQNIQKKNEQFNSWRVGVHPNLLACERFKHPCFVCSLVLVAAVPWILEVSKRHASSLGDIIYGHGKTMLYSRRNRDGSIELFLLPSFATSFKQELNYT